MNMHTKFLTRLLKIHINFSVVPVSLGHRSSTPIELELSHSSTQLPVHKERGTFLDLDLYLQSTFSTFKLVVMSVAELVVVIVAALVVVIVAALVSAS
ncbi:hypothetical protein DEU56DRAFT_984835 [Suillus clintonianus]|uniref:uncharacterized protein n=1 Tax=Suillus clintonianus TaxID=1904413 RepID=UPI001B862C1A|nr:uncharacterized protein DEU56DRAFT_984835 [Suillus clintonianus]KAG2117608.1 hypothetical protein DEU56DRAFT_984835 [Suillus clintonianus]